MTDLDALRSPLSFLQSRLQDIPHRDVLDAEEDWWKSEGIAQPKRSLVNRNRTMHLIRWKSVTRFAENKERDYLR